MLLCRTDKLPGDALPPQAAAADNPRGTMAVMDCMTTPEKSELQ